MKLICRRKSVIETIATHVVDNAPNEATVLLRFKGNELVDAHPITAVDASPFFPGVPPVSQVRTHASQEHWFALVHSHPHDEVPETHIGDILIQERILKEAGLNTMYVHGTCVQPEQVRHTGAMEDFLAGDRPPKKKLTRTERDEAIRTFVENLERHLGLWQHAGKKITQIKIKRAY